MVGKLRNLSEFSRPGQFENILARVPVFTPNDELRHHKSTGTG